MSNSAARMLHLTAAPPGLVCVGDHCAAHQVLAVQLFLSARLWIDHMVIVLAMWARAASDDVRL